MTERMSQLEAHRERAIEAAAIALYLEDQNASMSPDAWPGWEDEDNAARDIYLSNARTAIEAYDTERIAW